MADCTGLLLLSEQLIQLSEVLLVKTKTIKTPLMTAEAYGLSCLPSGLVPESTLSHRPKAHHCLVPKLSRHGGKNIGFSSLKNMICESAGRLSANTWTPVSGVKGKRLFFSEAMFLPRMMSLVAEQRVMMAGLVRELAHRQKAMPSALKREAQRHQQRGFSGFC